MTPTDDANPTCEAALSYARRGWCVVPLHAPNALFGCSCQRPKCDKPGKHPLTRNGLDDGAKDEQTIRRWWAKHPWANIGIRAGAISGLVVLDVDTRHGGDESLISLQAKHEILPATVEVLTGGGGRHFYFAHPGGTVRNQIGSLGSGLDLKADGGYVVAPPSRHASGKTYEWELSSHPDDQPLAAVPSWLTNDLPLKAGASSRPSRRADTDWRELVTKGAVEGERNARVASLAGHLLARGLDPFVVLDLLLCWNAHRARPPLPEDEVFRTVDSIAGRELRHWSGGGNHV